MCAGGSLGEVEFLGLAGLAKLLSSRFSERCVKKNMMECNLGDIQ